MTKLNFILFPQSCVLAKYFFRLEALMCYTATMLMEKIMKIFRGVAIGCLKSKWKSSLYICMCVCVSLFSVQTVTLYHYEEIMN